MLNPLFKCLVSVSLLVSFCYGDLFPTLPDGDTVWKVGSKVKIAWTDGDVPPKLSSLEPFKIELCTGADQKQVVLQTISNSTDNTVEEMDFTVPNVAPYGKIYFLKFTAPNPDSNQDDYYFWTTRFTITDTDNSSPSPSSYGTGVLTTTTASPTTTKSTTSSTSTTNKAPAATNAPGVVSTKGRPKRSNGGNLEVSFLILTLPMAFFASIRYLNQ